MGFFDDVDVSAVPTTENEVKAVNSASVKMPESKITEDASNAEKNNEDVDVLNDSSLLLDELMPIVEENNAIEDSSNDIVPGESNDVFAESEKEKVRQYNNKKSNESSQQVAEKESVNKKSLEAETKIASKSKEIDLPINDTVINQDTVVEGNLISKSDVVIYGSVKGNVKSQNGCVILHANAKTGSIFAATGVNIGGTVSGDVNSKNATLEASGRLLKGKLLCTDSIIISESAIVVGDIKAGKYVEISGAVKGNIESEDKVLLRSTAIIQGNISSASIVIEDGAAIDGTCTQAYAKVKPSDFFKDIQIEDE